MVQLYSKGAIQTVAEEISHSASLPMTSFRFLTAVGMTGKSVSNKRCLSPFGDFSLRSKQARCHWKERESGRRGGVAAPDDHSLPTPRDACHSERSEESETCHW